MGSPSQGRHDADCEPSRLVGVRDPDLRSRLADEGWARFGPVLDDSEVEQARAIFAEASARLARPLGDSWFPTIMLPEEDVRAFIDGELRSLFTDRLHQVLDLDALSLMRLDYSVKPASPDSELGPHQDFSLVDERDATSLYLWVPLVDTDEQNGTLYVVPGSHRFSNRIRSQHVPSRFDDILELVKQSAVRVDCRAGELIVMVSGVIHFSPPNLSGELRLAAHGIVTPADVPLVFYFADEFTPPGRVECYEVDIERYVSCIRYGRPDVSPTALVERPPESMSRDRFLAGLHDSGERQR